MPPGATEGVRELHPGFWKAATWANIRHVGDISFSAPIHVKFESRSELTDVSARGFYSREVSREHSELACV